VCVEEVAVGQCAAGHRDTDRNTGGVQSGLFGAERAEDTGRCLGRERVLEVDDLVRFIACLPLGMQR
jgi:hypothetical protein